MKVLFVYLSWTGEYGIISHFARRAGVYPPLNLALLAAIAEQHGHEAGCIIGDTHGLNGAREVLLCIRSSTQQHLPGRLFV